MSAKGIYEINGWLPVNLSWNSSDNILNADKYLEDLDIRLAFHKVGVCYLMLPMLSWLSWTYIIFSVISRSCFPCCIPLSTCQLEYT